MEKETLDEYNKRIELELAHDRKRDLLHRLELLDTTYSSPEYTGDVFRDVLIFILSRLEIK